MLGVDFIDVSCLYLVDIRRIIFMDRHLNSTMNEKLQVLSQ